MTNILRNGTIKNFICNLTASASYGTANAPTFNNSLSTFLYQLVQLDVMTRAEADAILKKIDITSTSEVPAQRVLDNNYQEIYDANLPLRILFIIFGIMVILVSLGCAYLLCNWYNINGWNIIKFNIVMALIIISIESFFFGFTAIKYVPFDIPLILSQFKFRLQTYLESLTTPTLPPCTINSFTQVNNYYISYTMEGVETNLDDAKSLCINTPGCAGVTTTPDNPVYMLTAGTVKQTYNPSLNKGATSWILNGCKVYP